MATMEARPVRELRVDQVAERLSCSVDKVYELLEAGRFPGAHRLDPRKPKSPWRIPPAALESYLAGT
jgi:excisionase family DNA binding protein